LPDRRSMAFDSPQRIAVGIAFVSLVFLVFQIVYSRPVRESLA